ncbi:MAG: hypothetical protein ACUVR0_08730 [Candidatus Aminicenantales bacterium]
MIVSSENAKPLEKQWPDQPGFCRVRDNELAQVSAVVPPGAATAHSRILARDYLLEYSEGSFSLEDSCRRP